MVRCGGAESDRRLWCRRSSHGAAGKLGSSGWSGGLLPLGRIPGLRRRDDRRNSRRQEPKADALYVRGVGADSYWTGRYSVLERRLQGSDHAGMASRKPFFLVDQLQASALQWLSTGARALRGGEQCAADREYFPFSGL